MSKKLLSRLALASLCALSVHAFAAEGPSVTLDRPGVGMHEIKKGDKVPDEYKRKELALGDWKKHKLAAPDKDSQWVEIKGKYVLVNIPNGTIKEMVPKSKSHR